MKKIISPLVFILILMGSFSPVNAESLFKHAEVTFVDAFDSTGLAILTVGAIATAVAANSDQSMRQAWVGNQRMPGNFSAVGDYWGRGYVEVGVALGQLYFDHENGMVTTEGLVESFVALQALKYGVGRTRPDGSDNLSFPSGHTTTSFSFAASMGVEYPWYVSVPSYAMAVYTGFSRIADDKHWLSDTVAGATLGILFGRAGYKHHFNVSPMVINDSGDGFGLVATYRF